MDKKNVLITLEEGDYQSLVELAEDTVRSKSDMVAYLVRQEYARIMSEAEAEAEQKNEVQQ